jgi:U4/U6.U5 tri-snRNP-associated protein 2
MIGRGFKSHAYTHSVQEGHHVFLNLETKKFYCLPDNYQIIDQSLEDIVVCSSHCQCLLCYEAY